MLHVKISLFNLNGYLYLLLSKLNYEELLYTYMR